VTIDDFANQRRHVSRRSFETEVIDQPDERAAELGVLGEADLLSGDDARFELLREARGGGEATDQLHASFGQEVGATLISDDVRPSMPGSNSEPLVTRL
jgi:hypothetical protein